MGEDVDFAAYGADLSFEFAVGGGALRKGGVGGDGGGGGCFLRGSECMGFGVGYFFAVRDGGL